MADSEDSNRLDEERWAQKPDAFATSSPNSSNSASQVPPAEVPEHQSQQPAHRCPEKEREIEEAHRWHIDELERRDRREEFDRQMARDDRAYLRKLEEEGRKLREDQRKAEVLTPKTQLPNAKDLAKAVGIPWRVAVEQLKTIGMPDVKIWSDVPWEYAVKLHQKVCGMEESSQAVAALYSKHRV